MDKTRVLTRMLALLASGIARTALAESLPEPATAGRIDEPIHLDGRLDEPPWSSATPVTRFFEIYPGNVEAPQVATEARFIYDDQNIYVAIRAHDPEPAAIRSSLVRRDQVSSDQDYVEVLLDPQGQRHGGVVFRTNARGVATDAQFNEDTQARDFSPDFNFDVGAAIDAEGWSAEFRIPLSTLRYRPGDDQPWIFVIYRNRPRSTTTTIASIAAHRSANCTLCLAGELLGIALRRPTAPLYVTPYVSYKTTDVNDGVATSGIRETHSGIDAKWQPGPDTIVDLTIAPDFSQVEADALQLSANTLFAITATEKRPFFLEGTDLLSTPIRATYTRSFAAPDAGVRLTRRADGYDYTTLLLREGAGDRILEPAALSSRSGVLQSESTVLFARHELHGDSTTLGTLASGRRYDDGSRNVVFGADAVWAPSMSDRVSTQFLWSHTRTPNRPDLLSAWSGQQLRGAAAFASWSHTEHAWNSSFTYSAYSRGFRAWNGFVGQVDVSRASVSGGLSFYPDNPYFIQVSPTVSFSRSDEIGGPELSRSVSPSVRVEMAQGTALSLTWSPDAKSTSLAGTRSSDSLSFAFSTTLAVWMPGLSLSGSFGDGFDSFTGEAGDSFTWATSVPVRLFGRLEINASAAQQSLKSRQPDVRSRTLISETNEEINAVWHLSGKLYLQGALQRAHLRRQAPQGTLLAGTRSTSTFSSVLLSYQTNWQTRCFLGYRRTSSSSEGDPVAVDGQTEAEIFAKVSYVFSM